jgi:predicted TIM-barrel fold metal-dependent hydrolase
MDIVDAQVHANVLPAETVLAIMDAIGIRAVVIDEYLSPGQGSDLLPAYTLPNGVSRPIGPSAEAAALRYPDRFAFLMRINPFDPALEGWIELLKASPNLRALRAIAFGAAEGAAFERGGFDRLFAAADASALPIFVTIPGRVGHLAAYARKFPNLQFVIDHCGVVFDGPPGEASLDGAITMAQYPNVAFKWAHAPAFLSVKPYPFRDLEPKLARVLDAYGRERVMWASDYTVSRRRQSWAEALFCLRDSLALSETDKEWILGRTARTLLNWPVPDKPAKRMQFHPHGLGDG